MEGAVWWCGRQRFFSGGMGEFGGDTPTLAATRTGRSFWHVMCHFFLLAVAVFSMSFMNKAVFSFAEEWFKVRKP